MSYEIIANSIPEFPATIGKTEAARKANISYITFKCMLDAIPPKYQVGEDDNGQLFRVTK